LINSPTFNIPVYLLMPTGGKETLVGNCSTISLQIMSKKWPIHLMPITR